MDRNLSSSGGVRIYRDAQKAAIFEKFNSSQRWTELHFECVPMACLVQGCSETSNAIAQKMNRRNPGEKAAHSQDEL